MGVLDDAIREHLDLQRRRGANPSDVERAEREALGPVRRVQAPDGAEPGEVSDPADPADELALDHEADPAGGAAFDHEADAAGWSFEHDDPEAKHDASKPEAQHVDPEADASAPVHDVEPAPERPREPERRQEPEPLGQETALHRPDFLEDSGLDEPDFESPRRAAPPPQQAAGGETVEYDVEDGLEALPPPPAATRESGEGEELLEETPEFLQDTPDHDRLWFEQRPPKDFDFDG